MPTRKPPRKATKATKATKPAVRGTKSAAKPAPTKREAGVVFLDVSGRAVLGPYDDATSFRDGYAAVKVGAKWGVLDARGTLVVKPRFAAVGEIGDGLVAVRDGEKVGYVDCATGAWAIAPAFDFALGFRGGFAPVVTGGEIPDWAKAFQTQPSGGAWGLVDKTGRVVLAMKHGGVTVCDGVALVNHGGRASGFGSITIGGTFGYVDLATGKKLGKTYDGASPMSEGRAFCLRDGNSTRWTIVDRHGQELDDVDLHSSATPGPLVSGRAVVDRRGKTTHRTTYAIIDRDGAIVAEDLGEAHTFSDGMAVVNRGGEKVQGACRGGTWGFLSVDGTFVTRTEWTETRAFSEGRGIAVTKSGSLVVDRAGETITASPRMVFAYANGLALARGPA